jgi:hypothetical protein
MFIIYLNLEQIFSVYVSYFLCWQIRVSWRIRWASSPKLNKLWTIFTAKQFSSLLCLSPLIPQQVKQYIWYFKNTLLREKKLFALAVYEIAYDKSSCLGHLKTTRRPHVRAKLWQVTNAYLENIEEKIITNTCNSCIIYHVGKLIKQASYLYIQ